MKTKNEIHELILQLVKKERDRQDVKFGAENQQNNLYKWACIMGEEQGEICKAINDLPAAGYSADAIAHLMDETIQTIAVGFAIIEQLETRNQNLFL